MSALLCIFNPYVGFFCPYVIAASVSLTLTWVVFGPYLGAFLCIFNHYVAFFSPYVRKCLSIFNPYVGCFQPLRRRVLVYF